MRQVILSAALCAALVMFVHAGVAAQTHTVACSTIAAMLGGSGTFKGVNEHAQADAKDVRDTQGSQVALQTYLAAAHKNLAAAVAIGDISLAAHQRVIIARIDNTVASNKRLLATSTATLDLTQQQQRTLRQEAAARRCTNLGYQAQPQPATGSGSTTSGAIDLAGSWVMHLHGVFDSPVEYYDYDAVLTGPPGGPWRITTTMRHNTSQLPNSEPVGRVDSQCTIWLTGPTSIERRCTTPPGLRWPNGAAEGVQHGSIAGDRLTLFKMTGLPLFPYGEMRRGTYQQAARQPAISPGTWRWSATCGGSQYVGSFTVVLQPDNTFYGQFTQDGAPAVNGTIAGRLQGANIVFNRRWSSPGEQQWSGTLDQSGAAMRGNVTGYNGPCTFSATKSSAEMPRGAYPQPPSQPATAPATWRWSATCGGSSYTGLFTVALQPDSTFYGQFTQDGTPDVNGTVAGRIQGANIVFNRRWSSPGEQQWSGTLDQSGAAMRGNVTGYNGPCTFSATKS